MVNESLTNHESLSVKKMYLFLYLYKKEIAKESYLLKANI